MLLSTDRGRNETSFCLVCTKRFLRSIFPGVFCRSRTKRSTSWQSRRAGGPTLEPLNVWRHVWERQGLAQSPNRSVSSPGVRLSTSDTWWVLSKGATGAPLCSRGRELGRGERQGPHFNHERFYWRACVNATRGIASEGARTFGAPTALEPPPHQPTAFPVGRARTEATPRRGLESIAAVPVASPPRRGM